LTVLQGHADLKVAKAMGRQATLAPGWAQAQGHIQPTNSMQEAFYQLISLIA
jgi:hypothetical protein